MSNIYMHTIDGHPAMYVPGEQIVFFSKYSRPSFQEVFVNSLRTIRRQQKASAEWRAEQGYQADLHSKYGYVRIKLEESQL